MAKSLLLISKRPEDSIFPSEIAIIASLSMKQVPTAEAGALLITAEKFDAIFVDVSTEKLFRAFEAALQESVGLFSDRIDANSIHFLSSGVLERASYLIQSPLFGSFISRNYSSPKEAGEHYGRIVKGLLMQRAFGLENFLKANSKIQVIKLSLSTQKQNAVEAVKAYLIAAKFQSRMATVVANAVDELLMNAMYDAPVDNVGKQSLLAEPRTSVLKLEGKNSVEMHIGFDGAYVGIAAIDLFGSVDKAKLLSHISKIYVKEEYKVRTSVAGAGIGLGTVFRSGGSFLILSEAGVRTEVIVFFKRSENFREFKDQFRFLSTQIYFDS